MATPEWLIAVRDTVLNRRVAYALWGCTGLVLVSTRLIGWLGLEPLVTAHRPWIGAVFLLTSVFFAIDIILFVHATVKDKRQQRTYLKLLREVAQDERLHLRKYVADERSTVVFEMSEPGIGSLEAKRIIFRSSQISVGGTAWPYTIQPWAYNYLLAHPEIVGLPKPQR